MEDVEKERPSAEDTCHELVKVRQGEQRHESVKQALHREEKQSHGEEEHQRLKQEYHTLECEQYTLKTELSDLRRSKDREIEGLRQQLEAKVQLHMLSEVCRAFIVPLYML